jgi:hypothetical protein
MSVPPSRRAARALLIAGRASPAASLAFTFFLRRSSHSSRLVMGQKRKSWGDCVAGGAVR